MDRGHACCVRLSSWSVPCCFLRARQPPGRGRQRLPRPKAVRREALRSQTAATNLRVEVGRSAPVDSMKIEVRLASIEQSLSRLHADRRLLLVQLGRMSPLGTAAGFASWSEPS